MKKLLLITGVIVLAACAISLLSGVWNLYAYRHVLDGSAALYGRLHQRMTVSFTAGGILAAIGAVCLIVQAKL